MTLYKSLNPSYLLNEQVGLDNFYFHLSCRNSATLGHKDLMNTDLKQNVRGKLFVLCRTRPPCNFECSEGSVKT